MQHQHFFKISSEAFQAVKEGKLTELNLAGKLLREGDLLIFENSGLKLFVGITNLKRGFFRNKVSFELTF